MNQIIKKIFKETDKIYNYVSKYLIQVLTIFHIIYFFIIFEIITFNIEYLESLIYSVHIFICFFLIFRFNPLRDITHINHNDSKIIFSTTVFILLNMFVMEVIKLYFPEYKEKIIVY